MESSLLWQWERESEECIPVFSDETNPTSGVASGLSWAAHPMAKYKNKDLGSEGQRYR
jgi:hypothetical protein